MSGERFTAWLSADERASLHELAELLHTSDNFILRIALRATLFDKPVPAYVEQAAHQLAGNASNTSNSTQHVTGART